MLQMTAAKKVADMSDSREEESMDSASKQHDLEKLPINLSHDKKVGDDNKTITWLPPSLSDEQHLDA